MSFTGLVESKCPGCSETEQHEIWSFVRGDQDETLRDRIKSGELNVLECPHCARIFYPDVSWVYADAAEDLLAFVFPASFEAEAERWRKKMEEDFERMRPVAERIGIHEKPVVFFGADGLEELLYRQDDLKDECDVAAWYAKELGLSMRAVRPAFAREHGLPRKLPLTAGKGFTRQAALSGLRLLLDTNDRLDGYRRWIKYLEGAGEDPPLV